MNLKDQLRLLREGILLEADDKKYDLPKDVDNQDPPPVDDGDTSKTDDDVTPPTDDDSDTKYDLTNDDQPTDDNNPDTITDESTTDDNSSDTTTDVSTDSAVEDTPRQGEILSIDDRSRKILLYKNFQSYRKLRDSVENLLNELTQMTVISDNVRAIINMCIENTSALLEKLNDYIIYRYDTNTYEVNYKNFMDFVLEKRILTEILEKVDDVQQK